METIVFNFEKNYNMPQKLVDSTSVFSTSTSNQELFKGYITEKMHSIFMRNFNGLLNSTITPSMLQGIYDDEFNNFMISVTLLPNFTTWKTNLNSHSGHSHAPELGNCNNVDFELGNYTHWVPSRGRVPCPTAGWFQGCTYPPVGGAAGATGTTNTNSTHYIVSSGMDPDAPLLPRVNPRGGTYSLRLGDELSGGNASKITHEVLVKADKPYFTYDFAVVFQNPAGHSLRDMPFFSVEFLDSTNTKIPSCGNYLVSNSSGNPGFVDVLNGWGSVTHRYKPWSRITVDLTSYVGQRITVRFVAADCGLGGHKGRAYIDGGCFNPEIEIDQDCKGIKLEADSGYLEYQWYAFDSIMKILPKDTNIHMYAKGPGLYRVRLISESSCTLYIDTIINKLYVILHQNITQKDPSCIGSNDGELTINAYGGTSPYTYSINNGATIVSTNHFTGLAPGNYTCIVYDTSGCSDTVVYTLTNPPNILPNLVLTPAICFNECNGQVVATPSGGTSPSGIYLVSFNGVFSSTKKRTNLCAGNHIVTVKDEKGCMTTQPFTITQPVQVTINQIITKDEDCFNDCSGSITINEPTAVEYSIDNAMTWKNSNVFNSLCSQTGTYSVAVKNAAGCVGKQDVTINQPSKLEVLDILDEFICLNKYVTKTAVPNGGTPPYTFLWNNAKTTQSISESPSVSSPYSITVKDAKGCEVTDEFNINLHPQPHASFDFNPGPTTSVFKTKVKFENTIDYGASLTYEWYISNLTTFNTPNVDFEFPAIGGVNHLTCLKVENVQGCRDSICHDLYIKYEVLLFVPNSFTPNKDGVNDVFKPVVEGLEQDNYIFYIFNRWGDLIFQTTSQSEGWDGRVDGKKVKEDAYIWRIQGVTKQDGDIYEKFGHVNVLHKL